MYIDVVYDLTPRTWGLGRMKAGGGEDRGRIDRVDMWISDESDDRGHCIDLRCGIGEGERGVRG